MGQDTRPNCTDLTYESHNQIDYGPLRVSQIRGIAQDAQGVLIPGSCIGVFAKTDHKPIAVTETDENGHFELSGIPDGNYRLVIKYDAFCPANAKVRIDRHVRTKKTLIARMRPSGIDTCSYVELK